MLKKLAVCVLALGMIGIVKNNHNVVLSYPGLMKLGILVYL